MNLFSRNSVGVRITDTAIEIVELGVADGSPAVKSGVRTPLADSVVVRGMIADEEALKSAFTEALARARPEPITAREIVFALPLAHTYTGLAPAQSRESGLLQAAVEKQIRMDVPLAPADALYIYGAPEVQDGHGGVYVPFAAASKGALKAWRTFFKSLDIDVSFAVSPLAMQYALLLPDAPRPVVLADMSDAIGAVLICDSKTLYYSFGRAFRKNDQALAAEIKEAIVHARERYGAEAGALALVPPRGDKGAAKRRLEKELGVEAAAPSVRIAHNSGFSLAVLGAALRGLDREVSGLDPLISIKDAHALAPTEPEREDAGEDARSIAALRRRRKKLRRQKILLGALALIGAAALGGGYWWQSKERAENADEGMAIAEQYAQTQTLAFTVPVFLEGGEKEGDAVEGRIAKYAIEQAGDYDEIVGRAKQLAEAGAAEGEVLWNTPVNEPVRTADIPLPFEVAWLFYSKEGLAQSIEARIANLNASNTPYTLDSIIVRDVTADGSAEYALVVDANLSLDELISTSTAETKGQAGAETEMETETATVTVEESKEETQEEKEKKEQIGVVLDTPTGWLNVRSGPGTAYDQTDRISPGDKHAILETSGGWHHIRLSEEKTGWVFSEYIRVE